MSEEVLTLDQLEAILTELWKQMPQRRMDDRGRTVLTDRQRDILQDSGFLTLYDGHNITHLFTKKRKYEILEMLMNGEIFEETDEPLS